MAEKKTTKAAATKTTKAAATKTTTTAKRACASKTVAEISFSAENVGFRAGDVYQALAAAGKAMSVAEIAKAAKISKEETYLGIGWLFKEGKVKNEENLVTLA